jgi:hypothetical protein
LFYYSKIKWVERGLQDGVPEAGLASDPSQRVLLMGRGVELAAAGEDMDVLTGGREREGAEGVFLSWGDEPECGVLVFVMHHFSNR